MTLSTNIFLFSNIPQGQIFKSKMFSLEDRKQSARFSIHPFSTKAQTLVAESLTYALLRVSLLKTRARCLLNGDTHHTRAVLTC